MYLHEKIVLINFYLYTYDTLRTLVRTNTRTRVAVCLGAALPRNIGKDI